uniref:hypothetical protein n=1 Tax=Pseudomonas aeruginosa TaxID=287 RepID=UPI001CD52E78
MSKELNKAPVEQAGGDERKLSDLGNELHNLSCSIVHENEEWAEQIGGIARELWNWPQARAALAQPSPKCATCNDQGHVCLDWEAGTWEKCPDCAQADCIYCQGSKIVSTTDTDHNGDHIEMACPKCTEQAEAEAEAERPEAVARVVHSNPVVLGQCGPLNANDELMTVAQHAASVARWAEMFNRVEQERDSALAEVERLTRDRDDCLKARLHYATQLGEALARVAELEKQEPVAWVEVIDRDYGPYNFHGKRLLPKGKHQLYASPVAQAQQLHDLDKQCRDDVARALGLRPSQERGFAWSYLLASIKSCAKASEDAAQAQHSVPEGYALIPVRETDAMHDAVMALLYKGVARTDTQKLLDAY